LQFPYVNLDIGGRKNMPEMRKGAERRQKPTPFFNRYLFRGKRIGHRRSEDLKHNVYVDRFKTIEWSAISLLLFLCTADAFLTLIHLSNGSKELNPILNGFYQYGGPAWFMVVKFGITLPGLVILFLHVKKPFVQNGIRLLMAIYTVLAIYQFTPWLFAA
jgi:hypothetical protein